MKKIILIFSLLSFITFSLTNCSDTPESETPIVKKKTDPDPDPDTGSGTDTQNKSAYMEIDSPTANQLTVTEQSSYTYKLRTTGTDPYVQLKALSKSLTSTQCVLTFEYSASAAVGFIQVFFATPVSEERSLKDKGLDAASSWKTYSLDLTDERTKFAWGSTGQFLRLDFGDVSGIDINIRNICFRERNEAEKQAAAEKENKQLAEENYDKRLKEYLNKNFSAAITEISVSESKVTVKGNYSASSSNTLLCEVKPWQNITEMTSFTGTELTQTTFSVEIDRYVNSDGFQYDRLLSKWVLVQNDNIISHGRYADKITPKRAMTKQLPANKKGLGGIHNNGVLFSDLDALGITSGTINIPINHFMYLDYRSGAIKHSYGGKDYYFSQSYIDSIDKALKESASRNIVIAAIILIPPAANSVDSKIGALLQHPDFTIGSYSMPNMTTPESLNCYAAALDFLADRYSRTDNAYGRIHHYIMHNEVDASGWTEMGANRGKNVYLDAYYKSMRLCYLIARQYDEYSEVMGSFTHSWAEAVDNQRTTLELLTDLLKYSAKEGDFKWGVAHHPYPQDLNEPKTWNDGKATFTMTSPLVTFKNLEVLDKWIKMSENKYLGTEKRTLWLSENGTNSRTYSEQDLREQAAGFAYAWKKIKQLDGIDGIQWHNWMDNRAEGGLRIGLRRFSDDSEAPAGCKPVWYLYQAAGTSNEDALFDPYKATIGIISWNEIMHSIY